jgi:DNA polymerase
MIPGHFDEDALRELELWSYLSLSQPAPAGAPEEEVQPVRKGSPHTAPAEAPRPEGSAAPTRAAMARKREPAPAVVPAPVLIDPQRAARIAAMDWQQLKESAAACDACGLCRQRKQAVFGVGAEKAPWLFVGEGPGADEDQQGEPFVGQAGKLLDAMLAAAGLARGREVYIGNVVKCRPPGNRTPTVDEAAACAPYLDRQIDLIQPKLIVALGKTAVTRLTGSEASMASQRGRLHTYRGIPVIATYHPAYLLRNLPDKLKAWEDLMLARQTFTGL